MDHAPSYKEFLKEGDRLAVPPVRMLWPFRHTTARDAEFVAERQHAFDLVAIVDVGAMAMEGDVVKPRPRVSVFFHVLSSLRRA